MVSNASLVSVEKRILLHLLKCHSSKDKYDTSVSLTQEGIAKAVGTNRSYVSSSMRKLTSKGYIRESTGRVKGGKKAQKCFTLTVKGKQQASKLKKGLLNLQITVKRLDRKTDIVSLENLLSNLDRYEISSEITEQDIFRIAKEGGTIDIEYLKNIGKVEYIDFSAEAPRILHFFGRKKEIGLLEKWVEDKEGHNIIFIHGIAGIGKTTLAAKLIEKYRGRKHLFWHNFHSLDTLRGVLFKLSDFLSNLDHDHLEMHLKTRMSLDYFEISRILKKSIGVIDGILIFDDFHKSNEKIREFFEYFLKMLAPPSKTKMLILSREIVPFYDRRDVITKKIVHELELEGLDFESSKRLLKEEGIDQRKFKEIYGLTAGNPLFLEFFGSKAHLERYMHDELFSKLEEDEIRILGMISIYRFPVSEEHFIKDDEFNFEKLYSLTQKSIVKKDAHDRYFVHDLIKQFFYCRLSSQNRNKYHLTAAKWYENRNEPIDYIEAIYHYLEGGKPKKASQLAIKASASILEGGYPGEFLAILKRFDEKNVEPDIWPKILILKGKARFMGGDWKKALLNFTQSADMASILSDRALEVEAICESGHILEEHNQFDKAMDCFKRCLDISKNADFLPGMGEAYRGIGRIHWRNSQHKEAIQNYKNCLEIAEKMKNQDLLASTYIDLGNVYDEICEPEKAIESYNKSLDILKNIKNASETARAYGNLTIMYRNLEDFKKAIEYGVQQLELAENLHNSKLMGYGYAGLSYCYAKVDDFANAKVLVKKAEDIASKIDNENIMYQVNKTYAVLSKEENKWSESVKYLEKNIELVEKLKHLYGLSDAHFELGVTYKEMGDLNNATKHFKIATDLYSELGLEKTKFIKEKLSKYQ